MHSWQSLFKDQDANNNINNCAAMILKIIVKGYTVAYVTDGTSLLAICIANANAGGSVLAPASNPQISK